MHRFTLIIMFTALLTGCSTVDTKKKSTTLHNATRAYENFIRWGDYESAISFINPEVMTEPLPDPESLKRYRVTSYEVMTNSMSSDQNEALQVVEIRYYNEDNMREVTIRDRQTWKYDEAATSWYLATSLPAFK